MLPEDWKDWQEATTNSYQYITQKIKLFFNHLVRADSGERELQQLPLPVSIIATDIGTGERVVLRDGSVTQAMRASMSVPGLLAPLDYRGRKLVDGMLVANVPVDIARATCADVVIAAAVPNPAPDPEDLRSPLTLVARTLETMPPPARATSS